MYVEGQVVEAQSVLEAIAAENALERCMQRGSLLRAYSLCTPTSVEQAVPQFYLVIDGSWRRSRRLSLPPL